VAAISGFGGAAILLPVLVAVFGVRDAVPILTVAQLIGNSGRVWFNRGALNLRVVGWFAIGAVPLAFFGGLVFVAAPSPLLLRLLGAFLLITVAWRHLRPGSLPRPAVPVFAIIGAGFSFLSALVGSVGPLMAPFFLAIGLVKGAYIGTEALATVIMHVTKLAAYGTGALLTTHTVGIGLALGPIMIAGSYLGKRVLDRLPERIFPWIIDGVLIVAGAAFLIGL
jgi:uncharacterized membrane protein YfcA